MRSSPHRARQGALVAVTAARLPCGSHALQGKAGGVHVCGSVGRTVSAGMSQLRRHGEERPFPTRVSVALSQ